MIIANIKMMINKFLLLTFVVFYLFAAIGLHAADVEIMLKKAYNSPDSADYFFSKARDHIKSRKDKANYYFYQSAFHVSNGNQDVAVFYANKALTELEILNDTTKLLTTYNNMAKAFQKKGSYQEAINILLTGLRLAEKTQNTLWCGFYFVNLGLNYHDFEDYNQGVNYGKKALQTFLQTPKATAFNKILALNTIAINFDDWNEPDSALFYHYKIFDFKNEIDSTRISFTYNNIGNTLLKQKKYRQAENWIRRALKITELNRKNMSELEYLYEKATNFTNLTTSSYRQNKTVLARLLLDSTLKYVVASQSVEKMRDYYQLHYQFSAWEKNYKNAMLYLEKYIIMRDSIFEDTRAKNIAELETRYQIEKKEKELVKHQALLLTEEKENRGKTIWITILAVATLIVSLLALLIYRQQKIIVTQHQKEIKLSNELHSVETENRLQQQKIHISRELHDNIGSQLTFMISAIGHLIFRLKGSNDEIIAQLKDIELFTKNTISELRDTVWATNSAEMNIDSLKSRLLQFFDKNNAINPQLTIIFEIDDSLKDIQLSSFVALNFYRIIQEATSNCIKHSKAGKLFLKIKQADNKILLHFIDDGIGFDLEHCKQGNGIYNIRKRTEQLKGNFQIKPVLERGTEIIIECPVSVLNSKFIDA